MASPATASYPINNSGTGAAALPPAASPPQNDSIDFHYLLWIAERDAGNAPVGTPPREVEPLAVTPCGCSECEQCDNGNGERVCRNCGVVCGSIHSSR